MRMKSEVEKTAPTIGVYGLTNTGGLQVYDINGRDEIISYRLLGGNRVTYHTKKLYSNDKGTYFNSGFGRIYLHDIVAL